MFRRRLHGGMIVLVLMMGLQVLATRPAQAAGGWLWSQGWSWLLSTWEKAGPEIDPNGSHVLPAPPLPLTPAPPGVTGTFSRTPPAREGVRPSSRPAGESRGRGQR